MELFSIPFVHFFNCVLNRRVITLNTCDNSVMFVIPSDSVISRASTRTIINSKTVQYLRIVYICFFFVLFFFVFFCFCLFYFYFLYMWNGIWTYVSNLMTKPSLQRNISGTIYIYIYIYMSVWSYIYIYIYFLSFFV